jgi:hypothetical protein
MDAPDDGRVSVAKKNRERSRVAEDYVSRELTGFGHRVMQCYLHRRHRCDIIIDEGTRVEVKSGKIDEDEIATATFKIDALEEFDYCVFVIFDSASGERIEDAFVFSREEVSELRTTERRSISQHEGNALLMVYQDEGKFESFLKKYGSTPLGIEREVHRNPNKYRTAWIKIR